MMMEIVLNNTPEYLNTNKASITVSELLSIKNFSFKLLVVKINGTLVKKDNYGVATIKSGDKVQVIHLISGG
ncbi:MAG TPA: sulfur carrier protein ThiS [Tenuifilaceae bacterium]|nr:sulfur carrier protein ThiS [Tenuifilaceae bacterium]HRX31743.1 sulfur carrier protein ThiS [Tenuifilaceae bacterium]